MLKILRFAIKYLSQCSVFSNAVSTVKVIGLMLCEANFRVPYKFEVE